MVFDTAFPFLGLTVTATLQDPTFKPLSEVPDTLQNFVELAATFRETFEVERTLIFANVAIDFADAVFDTLSRKLLLPKSPVTPLAPD
jgi:hypothetical protein